MRIILSNPHFAEAGQGIGALNAEEEERRATLTTTPPTTLLESIAWCVRSIVTGVATVNGGASICAEIHFHAILVKEFQARDIPSPT